MSETIKEKKVFSIKPFSHIRIGDAMYFEMMKNGSTNENLKNITCDLELPKFKYGTVSVQLVHVVEDGFSFDEILIGIYLTNTMEQMDVYLDGKWYGETSLEKEYNLGCDTASFEIETDKSYDEFHTGADGGYGNVKVLKPEYGFICNLELDGDLFDFNEVVTRMQSLF